MRIFFIFALGILSLFSITLQAQIAPECAGTLPAPDYNEDKQRAFLQNYFAASTIMTPLGPIVPFADQKASIGLEAGFLPPLSCQQRLVTYGELKTEDTNLTPIFPRPRLTVQLPDLWQFALSTGVTIIPPVQTYIGTVLHAGGEFAIGWRTEYGVDIGARGHLNMTRVRAEIATPTNAGGTEYEDIFIASTFGSDVGASYRLANAVDWLTPFASVGYVGTRTMFIIGDDFQIDQNYKHPWSGFLVAGGLRALSCNDHCEFSLEVSSAIPIFTTAKAKFAFVW